MTHAVMHLEICGETLRQTLKARSPLPSAPPKPSNLGEVSVQEGHRTSWGRESWANVERRRGDTLQKKATDLSMSCLAWTTGATLPLQTKSISQTLLSWPCRVSFKFLIYPECPQFRNMDLTRTLAPGQITITLNRQVIIQVPTVATE